MNETANGQHKIQEMEKEVVKILWSELNAEDQRIFLNNVERELMMRHETECKEAHESLEFKKASLEKFVRKSV